VPATGPHLAIAVLCERVITEGDGVLSIIRVIDRLIQTATGPDPPDEMPPFVVENQMLIALKSDRAKGRYTVKLVIEAPDGSREQIGEQDVNLSPGNSGINIIAGVRLELRLEGVYWIDVLFGGPRGGQKDELLTRVPLEAVYQRQRVPGPQNQEQS
jgi:hypothetical protein